MDIVSVLFKKNDSLINQQLQEWVKGEVDDDTIYYDFTNSYDVHDIKVSSINVTKKEYQDISVEDESIEVEASAVIQIKIILTIDDEESGIYDSEEKEMFYMETTELIVDQELEIPLNILFYVTNKDDYDDKCEIIEINKGKPIQLEMDNSEMY